MFGNLSDRLTQSFRTLRSRGVLTESDVDKAISDIRRALIDADVALPVVRQFTSQVREKAYGAARSKALNPGQQVVSIVHDELVEILGGATRELSFADSGPTVFMLAGLQGAGKTTLAGKLGKWLREEGKTVLLVASDLQRPNAVQQLQVVGGAPGSRCGPLSRVTESAIPLRSPARVSSLPARAASVSSSLIRLVGWASTRR